MMDLQTSTLTLSFWNMSRKGRKRSWRERTKDNRKKVCRETLPVAGGSGGLTMEKRTEKLWKYWRIFPIADCSCETKGGVRTSVVRLKRPQRELKRAADLRIGVLKGPVRGHVLDDVGQDGVDLAFLGAKEKR